VNRRDLLSLVAGAAAWPLPARAQQKTPVIGYLGMIGSTGAPGPFSTALREGLGETGFVEGRNVTFEYRWAEGSYDRLPGMAADLVARKVDVIVAVGGPGPALAAKRATATIPIVFAGVGDPLVLGLVASLGRPGGNLTGFSVTTTELMPKRFELLFDLVPLARTIALLINPKNEFSHTWISSVQEAARANGVELPILKAGTEAEIDAAFATLAERHADALLLGADPFLSSRRAQIVALASRHTIPVLDQSREFAEGGGLISYGAGIVATGRQVGVYTGRILKGEKPADLPVQQPTKFELVINLKTAKALGLAVPQSLLARADEVIE
jgi:putative tryptophan/tyrosine transport system substrate-binding protein